MSNLAEAITNAISSPGGKCTVGLLIARLPDVDRRDLLTALGDAAIPSTAISRGLGTLDHQVSPLTLQRHRRGDCGCPR